MTQLPDIAPRLPRGKMLRSDLTLMIDNNWIQYKGKIYGVDWTGIITKEVLHAKTDQKT